MKLCCYFNYAPLYRESIYTAIDNKFDTQFYFGKEVEFQKNSGIKKLDYSVFKKHPIEFDNKAILNRFLWRTKLLPLAFKQYDSYILTGDFSLSYIPFIIICNILGKKVYGWGHGPKTKGGKLTSLYWWTLNRMTGFFSYGEKGRQRMIELGYPEDKVHVIYNSLATRTSVHQNYKSNIYKDKFNNEDPVLIFIGRLTAVKRLENLILLLRKLNENNHTSNLVIVGDGPCKEELETMTVKHYVSNRTWFYGGSYDETVNAELIYNADVCISPGNVGLTALHAMQYGTPIISNSDFETQMPEYETIAPYSTGLLFEKDNYDDCYARTCEWLEFAKDRREEIRNNCYEMINNKWNSDSQIEILEKVLNRNAK